LYNARHLEQVLNERELLSTCIKTHFYNANRC
jgi:hypothetical protein